MPIITSVTISGPKAGGGTGTTDALGEITLQDYECTVGHVYHYRDRRDGYRTHVGRHDTAEQL